MRADDGFTLVGRCIKICSGINQSGTVRVQVNNNTVESVKNEERVLKSFSRVTKCNAHYFAQSTCIRIILAALLDNRDCIKKYSNT
jgi:hypothetical protein